MWALCSCLQGHPTADGRLCVRKNLTCLSAGSLSPCSLASPSLDGGQWSDILGPRLQPYPWQPHTLLIRTLMCRLQPPSFEPASSLWTCLVTSAHLVCSASARNPSFSPHVHRAELACATRVLHAGWITAQRQDKGQWAQT